MPIVPVEQNRVGLAEVTPAKLQAPDLSNTGLEAFGHGLQMLGAEGEHLAESLHEVAQRKAAIDAKDADNAALLAGTEVLDDPNTGYRRLQGKAAGDAYAPTLQALHARMAEIRAGLPTDAARKLFDRAAPVRLATWQAAMSQHAMTETERYQDDVSDTRVRLNGSEAINSIGEPERHERAIGTVASEMQAVGQRAGWTPEQTRSHTLVQVSGIRRQSLIRLADADQPVAAEAYLKEHGEQFLGPDRIAAETAIRISQDRITARERTAAAQQRAEEAHARSLQREQLSAVKVALDTGAGTAADWEKLATSYQTIGDTSASVEAHARAVEVGAATKYRGQGLPQLDQRITALQAKPSLSVDEAAELRGIRTLREQTQTRLAQPGGALAQFQFATGNSIEPLNPQDPGSFQRRAQTAISAARTYGRQTVEPLMPADAQPLKDLVSSGDANSRLKALMTIAHFGNPLAIDGAARQISAQGDGGFRIAATLLTLPGDAGAQAARDILRGPEAAKTNGSVFLPSEAKRVFQEFAAPALVGMPANYASDVLAGAQNLYIARMTQHGKTAWDENEWRSSIATATGAYNAHGQRYGGIGYFRDTPVSIPPGWTSEGLFRRLARATDRDWNKAAVNGTPMWPDGSPVTHSQINDLAPARISGTTYGLLTRNGRFLTAKNGGPFLFDAAKVPWR